jgi:hypothetical protein
MQGVVIPRTSNCLEYTFNGSIMALDNRGIFSNCIIDNGNDDIVLVNVYRNSHNQGSPCNISCKVMSVEGELSSPPVYHDITIDSNMEDPRLFVYDEKLLVSYNHVHFDDKDNIDRVEVKVGEITQDFKIKDYDIHFDIVTKPWEKNWLFFEHGDNGLYMIYQLYPTIIIIDSKGHKHIQSWRHQMDMVQKQFIKSFHHISRFFNPKDLFYNRYDMEIRGGAHPVLVDGHQYLFAHTREQNGRLYRMLVVVLRENDMKLYAYTNPITIPGYEKAKIIYPMGAVFHNNKKTWYVSCGLEDKDQMLITIPHEDILHRLILVT